MNIIQLLEITQVRCPEDKACMACCIVDITTPCRCNHQPSSNGPDHPDRHFIILQSGQRLDCTARTNITTPLPAPMVPRAHARPLGSHGISQAAL